MAISFICANCGKAYQVDERFAGKKAVCRECGTINAIPSDDGAAADAALILADDGPASLREMTSAAPLAMTSLQTMPVRVAPVEDDALPLKPGEEEEEPPTPVDPEQFARDVEAEEKIELADEPAIAPQPPKRPRKVQRAIPVEECPKCKNALLDGAFICVNCGFNLKTGKNISTAVVKEETAEAKNAKGREGGLPTPQRPPGSPSLRITAMALIIVGLVISALPFFGLASMAMIAPLLGAAMAMIGAAIYFIDGAWEWGLVGLAAMMVSIVILFAFGDGSNRTAAPVVASTAPVAVPALKPATTQASTADLGPKVAEVDPGKYSIRAPGVGDDPVEYWRPVVLDRDPKIRAIAIDRLKKLPALFRQSVASAIAADISDEDIANRREVMKQLALAKTPETVAAAITALDDKDREIAAQALALLAEYKDETAIEPIAKRYASLGNAALSVLAGYDSGSREKVLAAYKMILGAGDAKSRGGIIDQLIKADGEAAAALLMDDLADSDVDIRHGAMVRLAEMKYLPAIDPIAAKLKDDTDAAARALLQFGAAAEKATADKLADGEIPVRLALIKVLNEIASEESLPAIKSAAKDPDFALAMAAREVWRKISPGAFPPIEEAIFDLDGGKEFQSHALAALKSLPVDEHQKTIARKLFELAMGDGDPAAIAAAYDDLEIWADQATRDRAFLAIKPDMDEGKRALAIKLAVHFKDHRAIKPLCQCLADGKNLPETLAALRQFDNAPEEFLIPMISKGDATLQTNCFEILRDIGTRRCFGALNAIASNKTADEAMRKLAKQTMIDITRRLNTAAARKIAPTSRPATQLQELSVQH